MSGHLGAKVRNCLSCGRFYVPRFPDDQTCCIECSMDTDEVCPKCGEVGVPFGAFCHMVEAAEPMTESSGHLGEPQVRDAVMAVRLEVLQCKDCKRLVLATANKSGSTGTRLSHHKCSGSWTTLLSEIHPLSEVVNEAFEKDGKP